jgi:hypothetical protein
MNPDEIGSIRLGKVLDVLAFHILIVDVLAFLALLGKVLDVLAFASFCGCPSFSSFCYFLAFVAQAVLRAKPDEFRFTIAFREQLASEGLCLVFLGSQY